MEIDEQELERDKQAKVQESNSFSCPTAEFFQSSPHFEKKTIPGWKIRIRGHLCPWSDHGPLSVP